MDDGVQQQSSTSTAWGEPFDWVLEQDPTPSVAEDARPRDTRPRERIPRWVAPIVAIAIVLSSGSAWLANGRAQAVTIANGAFAYVGGPRDAILVVDRQGSEARTVGKTFLAGPDTFRSGAFLPTVSPTGREMAFMYWTGTGAGRFGLAFAGLDGTIRRTFALADVPFVDENLWTPLAWSPDAKHIAFSDWQPDSSLFVADLDSGALRRLPLTPGVPADSPAWSPDGSQLVYRQVIGEVASLDVVAAEGHDGPRTIAVDGRYPYFDDIGAWSPDGRSIVYQGDGVNEEHDVFVVPMQRPAAARNLTNDPADERWPAWSPDGRHLAWQEGNVWGRSDVVVADADGSGRRTITGSLAAGVGPGPQLGWSPDGTRIVATVCQDLACNWVVLDAFGTASPAFISVPGGIPTRSAVSWGVAP